MFFGGRAMDQYSRHDIFMRLLLHEKDDGMWQAQLSEPILLQTFNLQDLFSSSNLILRECNLNFALHCGCRSSHELIGHPINPYIFAEGVSDVTILNDGQHHPNILKFRTTHDPESTDGSGYLNTVGLVTDDVSIYEMLGRQYDITPQLRKHAEQRAVKEMLTVKEFNIFLSLAKGHSVKDIAWTVGSTEKAIYYHIENMERKMKTQSIVGIIQKAYRLGFMDATFL
jgi:DNA-binding CsgD family transcriptional regulator